LPKNFQFAEHLSTSKNEVPDQWFQLGAVLMAKNKIACHGMPIMAIDVSSIQSFLQELGKNYKRCKNYKQWL
jgi:hypothetical protein